AAGHGVADSREVSCDHVEVAFDDDSAAAGDDLLSRQVDAEQRRRLVVDGGASSVEVLGNRVSERSRAEADDGSAIVTDGEHQAMSEAITGHPAAVGRMGQAGLGDLWRSGLGTRDQVAQQGVATGAARGREAEPEETRGLL